MIIFCICVFSYWSAMCYLTPLLGGFVADTYLNRYRTILIFCTLYIIGLVVIELSIIPGSVNAGTFFFGMYIVALGTSYSLLLHYIFPNYHSLCIAFGDLSQELVELNPMYQHWELINFPNSTVKIEKKKKVSLIGFTGLLI